MLNRSPASILIANRTLERAQALSEAHSDQGDVRAVSAEDLEQAGDVDLLIDATSAGHHGQLPDLSEPVLASMQFCYSLNYGQAAIPLGRLCESLTVPFQHGLGMLVEQAACAFEIWTGHNPRTGEVLGELGKSISRS